MLVQKLHKKLDTPIEKAIHYYSILSVLGNWRLSDRECQLLAFTCLRGSISSTTGKREFCQTFNTSIHTTNNLISKLKRKGLLIKEQGKIKMHPNITIDFSKGVTLNITLHG